MIRSAALATLIMSVPEAVHAATPADQAFVDAFGAACIPGRLNYGATRDAALAAGFALVERDDHPELAAVMARGDEELGGEDDADLDYETTLYARDVAGLRLHLAVSHLSSTIGDDPEPFVQVGCNLYNFDATEPVDPEPVSALLDTPIAYSVDRDGLYGHVWGPPCSMPRTFDTYLSYLSADTPAAVATGFDGVTLNFSTSSPKAGEEVPETYC